MEWRAKLARPEAVVVHDGGGAAADEDEHAVFMSDTLI